MHAVGRRSSARHDIAPPLSGPDARVLPMGTLLTFVGLAATARATEELPPSILLMVADDVSKFPLG